MDVSSQPRLIYSERTLIGLRVLPTYILIPTNSEIDWFLLPPSFPTKVLFFMKSKPKIYMACMTCFNLIYNYFHQSMYVLYSVERRKIFSSLVLTAAPLVPIDLTVTWNIKEVDEYWERLHYNLNVDMYNGRGRDFDVPDPKHDTLSSLHRFLSIVKNRHNCTTWETCCRYLKGVFFRFSGDPFGWYFPSPYGVTFETYRYSVFLDKDELGRAKFSFNTFISPFTMIGWLCVILSVACTSIVLRLSGFENGSFKWTTTELIEQGDTDEGKKNKKILMLVTIWIFACILIRNVYTSSLYYYMTVIQSSKNLPNSFDNLLHESKDIVGVFDEFVSNSLLRQRNRMRTGMTNFSYGHSVQRLEQTTEKFVTLTTAGIFHDAGTNNEKRNEDFIDPDFEEATNGLIETSTILLVNFLNKLRKGEKIFQCEKFLEFMTEQDDEKNWDWGDIRVSYKTAKTERNFGRFALLIQNKNFHNKYQDKIMTTPAMEIVIALFGGRKLITNNDMPVLVQPTRFWNSVTRHFFTGNFQKDLSSVIESGIYQRFEDFDAIKGIFNMIKSVSKNFMGGRLHWSFYNVAINLKQKRIDGIVERDGASVGGTRVEELDMVWCLHLFLCLVSGFVLSMELMWPWINESGFGFIEW
ncbi:unnamed protein product [Orchesella dallaii]|uniref:Uncharacterized protein n=1 Tax=Orchesella dallaii TaxID=48710 RepID=A0ABP1RLX9_9HEXA